MHRGTSTRKNGTNELRYVCHPVLQTNNNMRSLKRLSPDASRGCVPAAWVHTYMHTRGRAGGGTEKGNKELVHFHVRDLKAPACTQSLVVDQKHHTTAAEHQQ